MGYTDRTERSAWSSARRRPQRQSSTATENISPFKSPAWPCCSGWTSSSQPPGTGRTRGIIARSERGLAALEGGTFATTSMGTKAKWPHLHRRAWHPLGVDSARTKTGFYLDQRENRRVAASYMRGRRVLDISATARLCLAARCWGAPQKSGCRHQQQGHRLGPRQCAAQRRGQRSTLRRRRF